MSRSDSEVAGSIPVKEDEKVDRVNCRSLCVSQSSGSRRVFQAPVSSL